MTQHAVPRSGERLAVRLQCGERRNRYSLVLTLLAQNIEHDGGRRARVFVSEQVDDVIEVAWTRPFGQRPCLFREHLFVGLAVGKEALFRFIGIRMEDRSPHRRQHEPLVGKKIKPDARQPAAVRRYRAAVGDFPLALH